jgi:hypothetical protein
MYSVTAKDLLAAWERGLSQTSAHRLITLLAAVYPELAEEQLLKLPLGQRDALALEARARLFGAQLVSLATCPACSEQLELNINVSDIQVNPHESASARLLAGLFNASESNADESPLPATLVCEQDGYTLGFRLPDSQDLILAETTRSANDAHQFLLNRCFISATSSKSPKRSYRLSQLPETLLAKMEAAMSEADPQANVQLDLSCPACTHNWLAAFDIASFFAKEVQAWAQRILAEVHLLAKNYSWHEADILAMSPTRRRLYLEQIVR